MLEKAVETQLSHARFVQRLVLGAVLSNFTQDTIHPMT